MDQDETAAAEATPEKDETPHKSRKIELDARFLPLIPKEYYIFRQNNLKWKRIDSLNDCSKIDNVFLVPKEKLNLKGYSIFEI